MKTLMRWLCVICVVSWVLHNPAETATGLRQVVVAGQSLITSVAGAVSSGPAGTPGTGGR